MSTNILATILFTVTTNWQSPQPETEYFSTIPPHEETQYMERAMISSNKVMRCEIDGVKKEFILEKKEFKALETHFSYEKIKKYGPTNEEPVVTLSFTNELWSGANWITIPTKTPPPQQ